MLQIHTPEKFSKFLQGGTISVAECLTTNQVRRIINLQDSWVFLLVSPIFVRQLWGGSINRDRMKVLMSARSRVRNFRGKHGSWRILYHHRMGGVATTTEWVRLGVAFGNPSM